MCGSQRLEAAACQVPQVRGHLPRSMRSDTGAKMTRIVVLVYYTTTRHKVIRGKSSCLCS